MASVKAFLFPEWKKIVINAPSNTTESINQRLNWYPNPPFAHEVKMRVASSSFAILFIYSDSRREL
jgi:hypothetical protein